MSVRRPLRRCRQAKNETLFNSFVGLRCPAEDYDDYGFVLVVESARRVIVGLVLSGAAAGLFPFGDS